MRSPRSSKPLCTACAISRMPAVGWRSSYTQELTAVRAAAQRAETFGMRNKPTDLLLELADRVQTRLSGMFDRIGKPESGSGLDQAGLRDGQDVIENLVRHGEGRLAAEHLLYMIVEAGLRLSASDQESMLSVCRSFGIGPDGLLPPECDA